MYYTVMTVTTSIEMYFLKDLWWTNEWMNEWMNNIWSMVIDGPTTAEIQYSQNENDVTWIPYV
jgi:hypothetical protein